MEAELLALVLALVLFQEPLKKPEGSPAGSKVPGWSRPVHGGGPDWSLDPLGCLGARKAVLLLL